MSPSKIEWTEETWNPTTGCSKVSPGCAHCYAEALSKRYAGAPGWPAEFKPWTPANAAENVVLHPERLEAPFHWKTPRQVFVDSMSDLFHENVPDAFIDQVFAVMALTPQHTYQVLTKRPERMRTYMTGQRWLAVEEAGAEKGLYFERRPIYGDWPLPNVWLGVSAENQRWADERIPILLDTPAAVRFVSAEPLLGDLDIRQYLGYNPVNGSVEIRRESGLSGSPRRRVGDRRIGPDMAGETPSLEPLDEDGRNPALRTEAGRERDGWRLLTDSSDVRQSADLRAGSPAGLPPLLRADSRGQSDQPQERQQGRQSPLQFGAVDVLREHDSFDASPEAWAPFTEGQRERHGEVDPREGGNDSQPASSRRVAESHSSGLRSQRQDGLENSARTALGLSPSSIPGISWVIVGGESGPKHRPFDHDWARSILSQCSAAGVAAFVKQLGGFRPGTALKDLPEDLRVREYPA